MDLHLYFDRQNADWLVHGDGNATDLHSLAYELERLATYYEGFDPIERPQGRREIPEQVVINDEMTLTPDADDRYIHAWRNPGELEVQYDAEIARASTPAQLHAASKLLTFLGDSYIRGALVQAEQARKMQELNAQQPHVERPNLWRPEQH